MRSAGTCRGRRCTNKQFQGIVKAPLFTVASYKQPVASLYTCTIWQHRRSTSMEPLDVLATRTQDARRFNDALEISFLHSSLTAGKTNYVKACLRCVRRLASKVNKLPNPPKRAQAALLLLSLLSLYEIYYYIILYTIHVAYCSQVILIALVPCPSGHVRLAVEVVELISFHFEHLPPKACKSPYFRNVPYIMVRIPI